MNSDGVNPIRKAAVSYLARREHSAKELADKLTHKGFERADVEREIAYLEHKGWQSDQRFAESVLRSRLAAGYGPRYIERDLLVKGISADVAHALINDSDIDWEQQARSAFVRHFGEDAIKNKTDRQKQFGYLLRKGFDLEHIKGVLNEQCIY